MVVCHLPIHLFRVLIPLVVIPADPVGRRHLGEEDQKVLRVLSAARSLLPVIRCHAACSLLPASLQYHSVFGPLYIPLRPQPGHVIRTGKILE